MDNIIVYVDDATHALQMLQSMCTPNSGRSPTRWLLVGCAPRVTNHASKWVTNSARESWRGKWAEKTFLRLLPMLQQDGDTVVTHIGQATLHKQTELLIRQYGAARVLDARRPKFGHDMKPTTASLPQESKGFLGYITALVSASLMVAAD